MCRLAASGDGTKRRDPLLTTASSWGDITLPMSSNGHDDVDGRRPSSDSLGVSTVYLGQSTGAGIMKRRRAANLAQILRILEILDIC